jgi:ABC-type glycerol-3-phosphate transport system substrate-binding protein
VRRILLTIVLAALVGVLSACGGPKADVSIFTMTQPGLNMEKVEEMEAALQAKFGESPTIDVATSPMFSLEKLIVEIAAGGHSLLILNGEQIKNFLSDKSSVYSLEDTFDPDKYPRGVIEIQLTDRDGKVTGKETGFFIMPIEETAWFQMGDYRGPPAFAIVPANAPNPDLAKLVLKAIVESE